LADYEDFDYNKSMSFKTWKKMFPFILSERKNLIYCAFLMLSVAIVDVVLSPAVGLRDQE